MAHYDWKIETLPQLAKDFHLSATTIESLRQHLEEERNQLLGLPQDADIKEVMNHHFKDGAVFRKMVTGKDGNEQSRIFGPTLIGRVRNLIRVVFG